MNDSRKSSALNDILNAAEAMVELPLKDYVQLKDDIMKKSMAANAEVIKLISITFDSIDYLRTKRKPGKAATIDRAE